MMVPVKRNGILVVRPGPDSEGESHIYRQAIEVLQGVTLCKGQPQRLSHKCPATSARPLSTVIS